MKDKHVIFYDRRSKKDVRMSKILYRELNNFQSVPIQVEWLPIEEYVDNHLKYQGHFCYFTHKAEKALDKINWNLEKEDKALLPNPFYSVSYIGDEIYQNIYVRDSATGRDFIDFDISRKGYVLTEKQKDKLADLYFEVMDMTPEQLQQEVDKDVNG